MQQKKVWFQKGQNLGSNVTAPSFLSVSRIASSMMWLRPVQLMLLKTNNNKFLVNEDARFDYTIKSTCTGTASF